MTNSSSRRSGLLKLQAIVVTLLTSSCAWQWHEPRPDVTNEVRSLIQQVEQLAAIRDYQGVAELNEQISVIFRREVSEEPFVDLTDHCRQIETKWGRLHEQLTGCLRRLAADALKKGDLEAAMAGYRRVRDLEMTAGRGFSPISINASLQLADLLRRRGELEQPVAILDELLADPFLDPVAQAVARIYLARTHQAAARFELALLLLDQILAEYPAVWHQDVATFMNLRMERALIYQQQGRLSSAESELETLAFDAFEQLGPVHTTTLLVMNALGQIYERRGKYDLAELALLRALDGMNQTLGLDHPDAAGTRNNLAVLYESQGRLQEAEGLYLETLRQLQSQRGAMHPDTLAISNNLAYLYMVMQAY
nr:tetratricopeptide repeat protein [Pseudomonadales bacterium]